MWWRTLLRLPGTMLRDSANRQQPVSSVEFKTMMEQSNARLKE
jgi:hypothetical protein